MEEIKSNQEKKQPEGLVKNFNLILELNSNLEKVSPGTFSSLVRASPHPPPAPSHCCSHNPCPPLSTYTQVLQLYQEVSDDFLQFMNNNNNITAVKDGNDEDTNKTPLETHAEEGEGEEPAEEQGSPAT